MATVHPWGGTRKEIRAGVVAIDINKKKTTRAWQLIQLTKMLTITIIPAIILIVFTCIELVNTLKEDAGVMSLLMSIDESKQMGNFIHSIQLELEEVTTYLANGNESALHIQEQFNLTDNAFQELSSWPAEGLLFEGELHNRGDVSAHLAKYRLCFINRNQTVTNTIHFYEGLNLVFIEWFTAKLQDKSHRGDIWQDLLALKYIMRAKEHFGIVMAYGLEYFIDDDLPHDDYIDFIRNDALADDNLKSCFRFSSKASKLYYDHLGEFEKQWQNIEHVKETILEGHSGSSMNLLGSEANKSWHDEFTEYLRILKHVEDEIIEHMQAELNKEHSLSQKQVGEY